MIKASIDSRDLEKKLQELTKKLNKEADQAIVEMAQLGGKQLAIRMEPYGINAKAEEISKKAIYRDVNNAYDYIGQTFNTLRKHNKKLAYAFANAAHNNDFVAAEKIARKVITNFSMGSSDNGRHLESVRNFKGRVDDSNANIMGIASDSELERIKHDKEATAGLAKAAWLQAAKSIGSRARIAPWLRKSRSLGTGHIARNGWLTVVTLTNSVKYVSHLLPASRINAALRNAYVNKAKQLEKQLEKLAKNF